MANEPASGPPVDDDPIFQPLKFLNLTVKNRLFRSSISGRWDNYDGSGTQARVNWEEKFAKGGVGAIITSFVPVHLTGRILPGYPMIDADDKIPFWREVINTVHKYDCKFIIQLSHGGRQRDVPGVENFMSTGISSTSHQDTFHGLLAHAASQQEIDNLVSWFAQGARRAREAGADGVELHSSHGYLFTQFLSSAINDRKDKYGGSVENRARFLLEVIRAIRKEVGPDFHVQAKLNAVDAGNALYPWEKKGNTLEESLQIAEMAQAEGIDAVHVSIGSIFPHPQLPSGGFPPDELNWWYGGMSSSGVRAYVNYAMFHFKTLRPIFLYLWNRAKKQRNIEGVCYEEAGEFRKRLKVPIINTGGYQDGNLIRRVIREKYVDAVSIARPLIANNNLPLILKAGTAPEKPCTFCNRCLVNAIANPLGCYDPTRFNSHEEMIQEVMTVYRPQPFPAAGESDSVALSPSWEWKKYGSEPSTH
ncbi:MAG TPA: NADH:flavin oxidoreductase [Thermoanaerobaculia bacterium]|nr:NADH:flavin oxidoreductase [Thermoanaerobaculia bacterium]